MAIQSRRKRLSFSSVVLMLLTLLPPFMTLAQEGSNVTLSLMLPSSTVVVSEQFPVIVQVNTPGQSVDGAAAYLDFDPSVLQLVQIMPSSALPIPLQELVDNDHGTVDLAFGQIGGGFPTGTFTLATLMFQSVAVSDDTTLAFQASAPRQSDVTYAGSSVFGGAEDAHLVVTMEVTEEATLASLTPTDAIATLPSPTDASVAEPEVIASANMDDGAPDWDVFGSWQLEVQDYLGRSGSGWRLTSTDSGMAVLHWNKWLNLTDILAAQLTFLSMLTGTNGMGIVQVSTDGNGWSTVALVPMATSLTTVTVDLSAFLGRSVQVRFVWGPVDTAEGTAGFWLVDEVVVEAGTTSVLPPTSTSVSSPTIEPTLEASTEIPPTVEPTLEQSTEPVEPTQEVAPTEVAPTVEPSVEQSTETVEPATAVPPTVEPTLAQPTTVSPTVEPTATLEPTQEPATAVPPTVEPTLVPPTAPLEPTQEPPTAVPPTVEPTLADAAVPAPTDEVQS